ncbi:hypothetical protein C8R41DRAFT_864415 [Lentinula lateritia]|uniref:F-box domain-containing protein n=1 Tax=Lentinula lateritia TaxID=40482 RepID=A0ABQ8VRC5_9AGAR|nr:hypothetical protein C8R41DRAFT_864415 [Lentinula lateritia]
MSDCTTDMFLKRLLRSRRHEEQHISSSACKLPVELWIMIGSFVEENLWALASASHFLSEALYPLLYREVICKNPSILLRCGTAWLRKPNLTSRYTNTLIIGGNNQNQRLPSRWELILKWKKFLPIFASFSHLTHLGFIFQQLPHTFPVILTSLPLLTDLSLENCIFEGHVIFDGVKLNLRGLRLEQILWMEEPGEIAMLCSCPLLLVLHVDWHHQIMDSTRLANLQSFSSELNDLNISVSALFTWPRDRTLRLEKQHAFLNFVNAWRSLKRLTVDGRWPIFEREVFPQGGYAVPHQLESYTGPLHLFRSSGPPHLSLTNVTFLESHVTTSELVDFLPSLPVVTRVALIGICLEQDPLSDEDVLGIAFRQCHTAEEFLIDLAHTPEASKKIFDAVRRNIYHLQKIRYLIIPDVNVHDKEVEEVFDHLHYICPSLQGIRVHDEKWIYTVHCSSSFTNVNILFPATLAFSRHTNLFPPHDLVAAALCCFYRTTRTSSKNKTITIQNLTLDMLLRICVRFGDGRKTVLVMAQICREMNDRLSGYLYTNVCEKDIDVLSRTSTVGQQFGRVHCASFVQHISFSLSIDTVDGKMEKIRNALNNVALYRYPFNVFTFRFVHPTMTMADVFLHHIPAPFQKLRTVNVCGASGHGNQSVATALTLQMFSVHLTKFSLDLQTVTYAVDYCTLSTWLSSLAERSPKLETLSLRIDRPKKSLTLKGRQPSAIEWYDFLVAARSFRNVTVLHMRDPGGYLFRHIQTVIPAVPQLESISFSLCSHWKGWMMLFRGLLCLRTLALMTCGRVDDILLAFTSAILDRPSDSPIEEVRVYGVGVNYNANFLIVEWYKARDRCCELFRITFRNSYIVRNDIVISVQRYG